MEAECDLHRLDEADALRLILEGTATETGAGFFAALVRSLSRVLNTHGAWVTEYLEEKRRLKALGFWLGGRFIPDFEVGIDASPCEDVIDRVQLVHYPDNIQDLFPHSENLKKFNAVSYVGVPLKDVGGKVLGHLAVIGDRPMPKEAKTLTVIRIFAARAAAELQRLRAEAEAAERGEKLRRLLDSAMDAVVELDQDWRVVLANPAAEKMFLFGDRNTAGSDFLPLLQAESRRKFRELAAELENRSSDRQRLWIPGGLEAVGRNGDSITAEATLSRFEIQRQVHYTLILRNVNERLAAERKIRTLTEVTEYLNEEIRALHNFEEIIGQSKAMRAVLQQVEQVAGTDATVLLLGETGTGKELISRAIHQASRRAKKPFIRVNCAAMPATLMESELFGHEAGAFTGANRRRKGRFELADSGTIFLDEISELPPEAQAKLLRVLQEKEIERLGGAAILPVDVRVIAASNRNLNAEILAGRFRADLFYRLNVYPIVLPPLRKRRADIPLLVDHFVKRLAEQYGKTIDSIPGSTQERLAAYPWPGNVRELRNVVERAVITSTGPILQLPDNLESVPAEPENPGRKPDFESLETVEKRYIEEALHATGWRISGPKGAAGLLGMNPSTLRFRMKKFGIRRPDVD